jgi:citrate lyase beta subunit
MTATTLSNALLAPLRARLATANQAFAEAFPGESARRQPVHTVYGGANLFKADLATKMAGLAQRQLAEYAPDAASFAQAFGLELAFATRLRERVADKIAREAVEDFRIDFEDGYGNRPDAEEDAQAVIAAEQTAKGMAEGTLPPFIGIRIKPLTEELASRSLRTLDLYVTALASLTGQRLPDNFVVTLPKVTHPEQVEALVAAFEALEQALGLSPGALQVELMVETTQSIFDVEGRVALPALIRAGRGRVRGCHFGTYDYTASCNVTAAYQRIDHPACDFATHVMQVALGGTGIWMSDGATTIMPVPVHRAKAGETLTEGQLDDNRQAVHRAWKLAFDNVTHALRRGIYQGWDLHPGQLIARYAAVDAFFLESLAPAAQRLGAFIKAAAQATLVGDTFDDAATGQGLLNYFLRALNCGAISEAEATATGLTLEELRGKSFVKIVAGRRHG